MKEKILIDRGNRNIVEILCSGAFTFFQIELTSRSRFFIFFLELKIFLRMSILEIKVQNIFVFY